jgi:MFS family permease
VSELQLSRWTEPPVLAAAALALASGMGTFGITAALGDIAREFGQAAPGEGIAAEVGMTGTALGIGLAVIRLASLASLPAASIADRLGRRRVLLAAVGAGLAMTVLAGFSPTYWWFVALLALARPLLTATNAVAGVVVAEETGSANRSKAVALVGGGYALGTGIIAVVRGVAEDLLGFRGVFFLAVVPLLALPVLARAVREPARSEQARTRSVGQRIRLVGPIPRRYHPALVVICSIHFGIGLLTGPVNSYLFAYGEQVLDLGADGMALVFVVSGVTGFAGLLVGRWGADRLGRRLTAGLSLVVAAAAGFATYSGTAPALVVAYPLSVLAASAFTPAAGALDAELFPTSARATAAGWLTATQILGGVTGLAAFGILADRFGAIPPAALAVALPAALLSLLYLRLPETRGMELEESAPEDRVP